jgi:protein-S-isoprenylcysteine O-methyltransferase Ste14
VLILLFFLATLVFAYYTWRYAIVHPRRQGPYRFVAFEGITAIVLLNWRQWFVDPFSPLQLVSFTALAISIYLALASFILLRRHGRPEEHFEYTTELVTTNLYRFIRHPMYASLLFFAIGAYLKQPLYWPAAVVFAIVVVAIFLTARAEEQDLTEAFGQRYTDYMKTTTRFIPFML